MYFKKKTRIIRQCRYLNLRVSKFCYHSIDRNQVYGLVYIHRYKWKSLQDQYI